MISKHKTLLSAIYIYPLIGLLFSLTKTPYQFTELIYLVYELFIILVGLSTISFNKINKVTLYMEILLTLIFFTYFLHLERELIKTITFIYVMGRFIHLSNIKFLKGDHLFFQLKLFKIFFGAQVFISLAQLLLPQLTLKFTTPVQDPESYNLFHYNFVYGTFNDTVSLPYFLIFSYLVFQKTGQANFILKVLIGGLIWFSGSIFCLIFFMVILLFFEKRKLAWITTSAALVGYILYLDIVPWNFLIGAFLDQRLGIMLWTMPDFFLNSNFLEILFGYGMSEKHVSEFILSGDKVPGIFLYDDQGINALNDTFAIAFLIYFGIISTLIFLMILAKLYHKFSNSKEARLFYSFILLSMFVNQSLMIPFIALIFYSQHNLLNNEYFINRRSRVYRIVPL